MNPDGWEGLQTADPEIAHKQQVDKDDVDRLYLRVFGSEDGKVGQFGGNDAHDWPLFSIS